METSGIAVMMATDTTMSNSIVSDTDGFRTKGDNGEITMETTQENYHIWKKNAPLLYNQLLTSSLLWPSLSIDWLPDSTKNPAMVYSQHRLLISTYSSNFNKFESIFISSLNLADLNSPSLKNLENFDYNPFNKEFQYSLNFPPAPTNGNDLSTPETAENTADSEKQSQSPKINNSLGVLQRIPHLGDVNKLKHSPKNPDLIATSSNNGVIRIFDRSKKPSNFNSIQLDDNLETCDILLKDLNNSEYWSLDWNIQAPHTLAASSNDGSISIWNLEKQFTIPEKNATSTTKYNVKTCYLNSPTHFIPAHDFSCNEIKWVYDHDSLLVSVGDDKLLKLWDIRQPISQNPSINVQTHELLNTLDINPSNSFKFISGTSSGKIITFDIRNDKQTGQFDAHTESITATKYSPHLGNTFASASDDSTVKVWDDEQLRFTHSGHLMAVNDIAWCPQSEHLQTIASVANDNSLHVWEYV